MSDTHTPAAADTPIDFTPTHRVTRITNHVLTGRIFFQAVGRSLEWNGPDAEENPGSPQDVPACVAEAITGDPGLAPHFRVQPIESLKRHEPSAPQPLRSRRQSEPEA